MRNRFYLVLGAFALVVLASCAKIYHSPEAAKRAAAHKVIAIAPPKVSIAANKKIDAEALKEQQRTESVNFQREMVSWMLRRKSQGRIAVNIQDAETTTIKLQRAGHSDQTPLTPAEMCKALEVDAVITSNYALSKPMSEGGAIAVGVIFGVWGSTNQTTVDMQLHDEKTQKMIWNYNHKVSGSVGSTPASLVDNLMRHASKRMPYEGK
jgi:hypothetical protein